MSSGESSAPVQLGVVLLCHAQLDVATRMAQVWADGGAFLVLHVDAKADADEHRAMVAALEGHPRIRFSRRRQCEWGRFSLVQATQDAAQLMLDQFPDVTHVYLASGSCLPLRPIPELVDYLARDPGRDYIESVAVDEVFWAIGGLNEERFTRYFPFDWLRQRALFDRFLELQRRFGISRKVPQGIVPHLGSQWWCLTRATLAAILSDPRRREFDRFFSLGWIPDESYFQTLARRHSGQIESRSLTLARFDNHGKPYQLYDDHLQMLEESGSFVARKVWWGANLLLDHFPHSGRSNTTRSQPDTARIEQLFKAAAQRRALGRPGLYMQSRFPRKDAENGKTSARYAVFQGFTELFADFEPWLASQIDADVHGHLLAREGAEFAGRPPIGPGALSAHPALRDHDPQGFLAALIRSTDRLQAFQFAPRDNQALNWFMTTDPNAQLFVLTGAWIVPLLQSDMPFDDVRRTAALLQSAEVAQLKILQSIWRRAQLQLWDLAEFTARPADALSQALRQIDPLAKPVDSPPPMHDISGAGAFLQRLRNAGLRPALTGHFPLPDPLGDPPGTPPDQQRHRA